MSKKMTRTYREAADWIRKRCRRTPTVGIVLGSGLGRFVEEMEVEQEIDYRDIPHFPESTVQGHRGKLVFGTLSGKTVVAMAGRFHHYEGYKVRDIVFPIRVMKWLGVETLLLSNAAGAVNSSFRIGDLMILRDHISLFIPNPLVGPNIDALGPRFPDMGEPYNVELIHKARAIASAHDFDIKEGVYVAVSGPTYETRAEYRLLQAAGADAVGMSTVQECIVACHMGLRVFAVSVITDLGLTEHPVRISHEEVLEAARSAEPKLATVFRELVASL
jgi:purine-nucleoside phosphorylase